jgi:hypothetical protein
MHLVREHGRENLREARGGGFLIGLFNGTAAENRMSENSGY